MADPLAVKFDLDEFGKLIQKANSAASAFENLNKSAGKVKAGLGGSGGGATLAPSGSARSGGAGQALAQRQTDSYLAKRRSQRFDDRVRQLRTRQRSAATARKGSFGARLQSLVSSTRFNVAGGKMSLSPLIGRAMALLGPEAMIAATALAALATAVVACTGAAEEAGKGLRDLGNATGTTGPGRGALGSLGSAMGIDMGGLSQGFQSKITSDPMARMFAAQMGISAMPRPFGDVDEGKNLLRAIDQLRKMPFAQRIRAARATGLEGALGLAALSEGQYQKTMQQGQVRENLFGGQRTQTEIADFQASLSGLTEATDNLKAAFGKRLAPMLTRMANGAADTLNDMADSRFAEFHPNDIRDWLFGPAFNSPSKSSGPNAAAATAAALGQVGESMRTTPPPGYYGHSSRGWGTPAAMNTEINNALDINNRGSFRLGAF